MARRLEVALERKAIVAAAFEVLAEDGLDGLNMRKLAARLSVQAPALYWHIGDKAELLGLMADFIYVEARAAVPACAGWREWLLAFGRALRHSLVSRRDGARICATARPGKASDPADRARAIAAPLVALGLDQPRALSFQASVISLTLGWSSYQENGPMHDFLGDMLDFDTSFELGLQALVRGYSAASLPGSTSACPAI
ncbi:MAG: TetR family transcriptional regulator [Pseudomonadota bacterium]